MNSMMLQVDDEIRFGHYPQTSGGKDSTPIEWLVLDVREGMALLLSKYGIDCRKYNEEEKDITWENCTLRKWLNQEFLCKAFSDSEQEQMRRKKLAADKNPEYSTSPGNATRDKVFLLSILEEQKYFKSYRGGICIPTAYAIAQGAYSSSGYTKDGQNTCWWWLRSPGFYQFYAANVGLDGTVSYIGQRADYENYCVRPAIWICLESENTTNT